MQNDTGDALGDLMHAAKSQPDEGLARQMARELVRARLGLQDPPTVGRYVIEGKIAEGAMGAVFRAHDPRLDRAIAIKIPHPRVDEDTHGLVAQEARALARLSHPNVLVVHDLGARDGQLWLAMELISGANLNAWRSANPEASWREILRLFVAAGNGLAAAHEAGVVHRDFKPDNVMVGSDGRVCVADFGLALIEGATHDEAASPDALDDDGGGRRIAGTPNYLPPEVLRGELPGPGADQYSFFISLREILQPQAGADSNVPPASVEAVIARGLMDDPRERHADMREVVARIEMIATSPPEDPRRRVMLDRVEQLWLGGVLSPALRGQPAQALPVVDASELIDSPWAGLQSRPLLVRRSTANLRAELSRAHGALLLLGPPGAGKTTALLGLARLLLERARVEPGEPAPVVLNLASLSHYKGDFADWLVDELVTKYGLPRRRVRGWLEDDAVVLFLDGLDEVAAERRRTVAQAIDAFRDEHPVTTILACREDNYRALDVRLRFGLALRIEPPDDTSIADLCHAHGPAGDAAWETLRQHGDGPRPSPLVVSLLLRSGAEATGQTPLAGLYDAVVERALDRPPALGVRERRRLISLLAWLASTLSRTGSVDLWLERMQFDWLPFAGQRLAARMLGVLAILAVLVGGNLAGNMLADRPPVVGLVLGVFSWPVVLAFNRGTRIQSGEVLRWSWRLSLERLPLMLALGLVVGLIFGSIYVLWVNVVLTTTVALVMSLVVGLEPRDREDRVRAGAGLWRALKTSLIVGPATGLIAGLAVGYVAVSAILPLAGPDSELHRMADPRQSLFWTTTVCVTLLVGYIYGGTAVTLYAALRIVQSLTTGTSLLLANALDRGVDRGLLQRVGGGWMFQHRTLLDYFARRYDGPRPDASNTRAHR